MRGDGAPPRLVNSARHAIQIRRRFDSVLVCTRAELEHIPEPTPTDTYRIQEMDVLDHESVRRWLAVHNAAFGRTWGTDEYERAMLRHPHLEVLWTFSIASRADPERWLGVTSGGFYRRNQAVGGGHYSAVVPAARRRGLATRLILHRYAALRDAGFACCENETTIGRYPSLLMEFELGFVPKLMLDEWNTPDTASPLRRRIATVRLERLYERWRRTRRH